MTGLKQWVIECRKLKVSGKGKATIRNNCYY